MDENATRLHTPDAAAFLQEEYAGFSVNQPPTGLYDAGEAGQGGHGKDDAAVNADDEAEVQRLAALSSLEYDRQRRDIAERLGARSATLDKMVDAARKKESADSSLLFEDAEPWPETVEPAELLTEIATTVRRFIVCSDETARAVSLWTAMTWFIDVVNVAPLAVITAPEKRCGKSQLLTLMGRIVARPIMASGISTAAMYRTIDKWQPTLLVDEADAFMKENEELRGVINSGHTRDLASIIRVVGDGDKLDAKKFSTWGAKAIAGINARTISGTMTDRSILLELRRKLPDERVDRIRYAEAGIFENLSAKLCRFAEDSREAIRRARPVIPDELNDRAQDNWEPLLAIADIAGGPWPDLARATALKLSADVDAPETTGVEMLSDIREVFEIKQTDRISTADLITALCEDEEKPWAGYNRGLPVKPRQVAKLVKNYGVKSYTIRIGIITAKGYYFEHFTEAFSRYLAQPPLSSVTPSQPATGDGLPVTDTNSVTVTENQSVTSQPALDQGCDVVTDIVLPPLNAEARGGRSLRERLIEKLN